MSVAAAENGGNARRTHSRALLPRRGSATPAELAAPLPRAAAGLGSFAGRGRRAHVPVGSGRYRAREPAKEPRPAGTGSRTAWALLLIGLMSQRPACSGRHGLECRPGRARVAAGTGWCAGQQCPALARVMSGLVCRHGLGWLGFCHAAGRQARHGLVCRPAWARLLTGLFCQPAVAGTGSSAGRRGLMCQPVPSGSCVGRHGLVCRQPGRGSSACGHWFVCRYGLVRWPGSCANFVRSS